MKRGMSRGEWLLICGPLFLFGVFAVFYVRWKATAPATLNPSPVPLRSIIPIYDGRSAIGLGEEVDASNNHVPGKPWHFLRWNTKDGSLSSQFDESRAFYNWTFSRDGELLALYAPGIYSRTPGASALGTVVVRRTSDGSEVASWTTPGKTDFLNSINIPPNNREVLTLDKRLERHDMASGKVLGTLSASQIFSSPSGFERLSFSPDGRMVAVLESGLSWPNSLSSSQKVVASTSVQVGGRMVILSFPSLRPIMRPQGDLYCDCSWESNGRLWGISTLLAGSTLQKLVRARIDLTTRQTHLETLEIPPDYSAWNQQTLSINGVTGQVVLAGMERVVVWGRDGQTKMDIKFASPVVSTGGRYPPGVSSPPRFSRDGRSLFRVNGTNVERYDLSRFLPDAMPSPTSTP